LAAAQRHTIQEEPIARATCVAGYKSFAAQRGSFGGDVTGSATYANLQWKICMSARAGVAAVTTNKGYRSSSRPEVMNLLPPLRKGLKVLEIGCGEGAFSAGIPDTAETWGIEPEPLSARVARDRLSKVFDTTFDEIAAELPVDYFDLVVCNDVIEHMIDHDAFLCSIRRHMAPGSELVGSVPNVRFYGNLFNLIVAGDWHYQDSGVLDRTHYRFFTLRSVRRCLEHAGFEVERLEGLNEGMRSDWHVRTSIERLFRRSLILLSAADVKYLQIGFRAAPRKQ
jgi:2-polyprenyl-3-methyl-5-hydroxy-6-metoxy-1,4-benzoquinol methylase